MARAFALVMILLIATGDHRLEKDFFKAPKGNRVERLRRYSLQDQYKIFRYGNDKLVPAEIWLADPIAERGASAIPFLMQQLAESKDDTAVVDILVILRASGYIENL
jgi:hypothetical protein